MHKYLHPAWVCTAAAPRSRHPVPRPCLSVPRGSGLLFKGKELSQASRVAVISRCCVSDLEEGSLEPVRACSVASVEFDFVTPWTVALQAPLSMGFSTQEYWSGLPCPPPGNLPDPGIKPAAPALQADFFLTPRLDPTSPQSERLQRWGARGGAQVL